mgnify:CR=1 FL=1
MSVYRAGLIGAGDFFRIQSPILQNSHRIRVEAVFDPNPQAAQAAAERLGARVAESAEAIFG